MQTFNNAITTSTTSTTSSRTSVKTGSAIVLVASILFLQTNSVLSCNPYYYGYMEGPGYYTVGAFDHGDSVCLATSSEKFLEDSCTSTKFLSRHYQSESRPLSILLLVLLGSR